MYLLVSQSEGGEKRERKTFGGAKAQLRLCPGETSHRERSGLTTTCGCLFGFVCEKIPRSWRDFAEKRALSARRLFFVDDGSIN